MEQYLSDVLFQIFLGHSPQRSTEKLQSYLRDRQGKKVAPFFVSSSERDVQIARLEKVLLAPIDLHEGPDPMQIQLAMKLNLFKVFSLQVTSSNGVTQLSLFFIQHADQARFIAEMIQCLNIVLLLRDPHRSFVGLFDQTLTWSESYGASVDEARRLSVICQLIDGLDTTHQSDGQALEHSKVLLACLDAQPNNARVIHFSGHYLSPLYRKEFLQLICQTTNVTRPMVKIVLRETQNNRTLADGRVFELIVDSLRELDDDLEEGIRCALELIDRMKRNGNKEWKTSLRLKQKLVWKLAGDDYPTESTRLLVAKFLLRTVTALHSVDRPEAIQRLVKKSSRSLLLCAFVFYGYLLGGETIELDEPFLAFLEKLIEKHSSEPIVLDLLRLLTDRHPEVKERILLFLQQHQEEDFLRSTTWRLFLLLKLFPESSDLAEGIAQSVLERMKQSSPHLDECLSIFNQCVVLLLTARSSSLDLYVWIKSLLKSFSTLSTRLVELLKILVDAFVAGEPVDPHRSAKLFAQLLKHPNFLAQLSSDHRAPLLDILAQFVSHYTSELSSVTIECAKHFPMLLSIYHPTLSNNDQHTLSCIYQYEKAGYSMRSTFIWGEAALNFFSSTNTATIFQAAKLEPVINLLEERMMRQSILSYPVTRRLRVRFFFVFFSFWYWIGSFRPSNPRSTSKAIRSTILPI